MIFIGCTFFLYMVLKCAINSKNQSCV